MKRLLALAAVVALAAACGSDKGGGSGLLAGDVSLGGADAGGVDAGGAGGGADAGGSGDSATGGCVPTGCELLRASCGQIPDRCGAVLACGDCTAGETCGAGGRANVCGVGTCTPKTCEGVGATCGQIADGCGLVVECGKCPGGQACNDNACGCAATTCAAAGSTCGQVPDGCGGTLSCGSCPDGETCGGGGQANQCGEGECSPLTCGALGAACGQASDGCGDTLDCGGCPEGETCGGGGQANQCGEGGCVKLTCAAAGVACGPASVGCGDTMDCGGCDGGTHCEGGACVCTPSTCADLGEGCGSHADGCGGTVDCGACPLCLPTCPVGYTCVAGDVCTGGDPTDLVLDVKSHAVHVLLLSNGQPAKADAGCYDGSYDQNDVWRVEFIEKERGYKIAAAGNCDDPTTFDVALFPGTYEVRAGGSAEETNLPGWDEVVLDKLVVDAPINKLMLDVKSHKVHGLLLANGQPAKAKAGCYDGSYDQNDVWMVEFIEKERGYKIAATGNCDEPTTFDVELFPGTYEVRAGGSAEETNLPGWGEVVEDALVVAAPISELVLDVTSYEVHGTLLANGQPAKAKAGCYDGSYDQNKVWRVELRDQERNYEIAAEGNCDEPMVFDIEVFPGTYEIRAGGSAEETNLPGWGQVVIEKITIP